MAKGWHGDSAGHARAARKRRWGKAQARIAKTRTPSGMVRASRRITKGKSVKWATKFVRLKKGSRTPSKRWPSEARWG